MNGLEIAGIPSGGGGNRTPNSALQRPRVPVSTTPPCPEKLRRRRPTLGLALAVWRLSGAVRAMMGTMDQLYGSAVGRVLHLSGIAFRTGIQLGALLRGRAGGTA